MTRNERTDLILVMLTIIGILVILFLLIDQASGQDKPITGKFYPCTVDGKKLICADEGSVLEIIQEIEELERKLERKAKEDEQLCTLKVEQEKLICEAKLEGAEKKCDVFLTEMEKVKSPETSIWRNPEFMFFMGAITSLGITASILAALKGLNEL